MAGRFDVFVVLGDMRTGSNLLEASLNAYSGLTCWGEVFNPGFIGHAGQTRLFDMTLAERDRAPVELIERMRGNTDGLPGFRLFPDHDPRVLSHCLADPRCAKIVLTRNPVDSYVSLKIARSTGQWWLGDLSSARSTQTTFDAAEFETFLERIRGFYREIHRALQVSGQTAFHIHYDDLQDDAVLDGLVRFLGASPPATDASKKGRVQNPGRLEDKVTNFGDIAPALARIDYFDIYRVPDFEPRRGANIPTYLAASGPRLIYMPMPGGDGDRVADWLRAADGGVGYEAVAGQKALRQWKRKHPGHRSFTVVSHPLTRAHRAFCEHVLYTGPECFSEIRLALRDRYEVPIPESDPGADYSIQDHRAAFLGFLKFLKGNLGGQTALRVPAAWASQVKIIQGLAEFMAPDAILREETLAADLARLLALGTGAAAPPPGPPGEPGPYPLSAIVTPRIEEAARAACQRDYMMLGYSDWSDPAA